MLQRILNILGWVGTALVFAAVVTRFVKPEMQQLWNGLAPDGLACAPLYTLSQWRDVINAFSGRQARYGSLAALSVLIVLGILGGINYVASRENKRWDLTSAKQFTLSDQTKKVLQNLKEPLKVHVFAREDDTDRFKSRL